MQETFGTTILTAVLIFRAGILAIWLYAAIRPRYGAGLIQLRWQALLLAS